MKLETLLKKREELEQQIREAQAAEKRKGELMDLLEKAGAFSLSNEQIMGALSSLLKPKGKPASTETAPA